MAASMRSHTQSGRLSCTASGRSLVSVPRTPASHCTSSFPRRGSSWRRLRFPRIRRGCGQQQRSRLPSARHSLQEPQMAQRGEREIGYEAAVALPQCRTRTKEMAQHHIGRLLEGEHRAQRVGCRAYAGSGEFHSATRDWSPSRPYGLATRPLRVELCRDLSAAQRYLGEKVTLLTTESNTLPLLSV